MDRREIQQELFDGFGNFMHQLMYPEMTADYLDMMRLRLNNDPLLRARVECLTAGVMDILHKKGAFDGDRQEKDRD